jgi:23S rRNA (adenine-N6)-dimethyltransferase
MEKQRRRQVFLAQNFLRSPGLVHRLVARSSIGPSDVVYEIGPGKGIITTELARAAKRVVAIEKDPKLVRRLRERFRGVGNIEIIEQDFLQFSIREREYKIFANIPYSITASIVRKILYVPPVPSEAYLILQKEPAGKFSGCPNETLFSLLAKPFFEFQIVAELKRTDFEPVPDVDSVCLRIARRAAPLVQQEEAALYREFVQYGFGRWKRYLRLAFKHVFTYKQWKRLSQELRFPLNATPTELTFEQWLGLFKAFKRRLALTDRPPD